MMWLIILFLAAVVLIFIMGPWMKRFKDDSGDVV